MKTLVFDCEQLRKPFTGFCSYCSSLARALVEQAPVDGPRLTLYAPESFKGSFGPEVDYLPWHSLHKYYLPAPADTALWHCTGQQSKYMPSSRRIPMLITIHDVNFMHMHESAHKQAHYRRLYLKAIRRATRIVTISESSKRDILHYFDTLGKPVDVVYNGTEACPARVQAPAVLPDRPFLLNINRVCRNKNVHVLPALLVGNDLDLLIAGTVEEKDYAQEILREARRWKVEERVKFIGPVRSEEKHWYLQHCEAFLFPSLAEGFGLPVLEALQYYKPVFCSDHTSLPEVGGDCVFYFDHDFDPDAMRALLEQGLQADLSRTAIDAHLARFTWDRAAQGYWKIYQEMI